jgi:iron(III) transport system substrate-binding protein
MKAWAAGVMAMVLAVGVLATCGRSGAGSRPEVVLYTSADNYLVHEVVEAFKAETGIDVKLVGDTEATKTTGLVERLLSEQGRPRADVWWSSEPFGTIRLASEGVLEGYTSGVEKEFVGGWPGAFRGADWYGFACRARVVVYNPQRVTGPPRRVRDLAAPAYAGRIGMARPQFGTTRGQVGQLLLECGEGRYRELLAGLKANRVRLYDGNSSVVRAVAHGEIDVGLTDTDDVWAGERNGWPVKMAFEERGEECAPGPILIPNTVGLVKGAPHAADARRFIDFLISAKTERILAASDSRNMPVRPALAAEFPGTAIPGAATADYARIAAEIPRALAIWDEVMGR